MPHGVDHIVTGRKIFDSLKIFGLYAMITSSIMPAPGLPYVAEEAVAENRADHGETLTISAISFPYLPIRSAAVIILRVQAISRMSFAIGWYRAITGRHGPQGHRNITDMFLFERTRSAFVGILHGSVNVPIH